MAGRPVAVLDANVLIPPGVRDLFLSCADAKLFRPVWQEEILEEVRRNSMRLMVERRLSPGEAAAAVEHTLDQMMAAFPGAMLDSAGWVPLVPDQTCDPKDRHVMAAAIGSEATHLVTRNTRDFPVVSRPEGVAVLRPDRFMLDLLKAEPDAVVAAVETMCGRLRRPTQTPLELTAVLMGGEYVPRFGAELRALFS